MFGKRLHFYAIYENPQVKNPADAWRAVPEGFSWFALLLPLVWALYHRVWGLAALVLCFYAAIGLVFGESDAGIILQMGLHLFVALSAGDIADFALRRRGYQFKGVVAAEGRELGLQRFLDRKAAV